MLHVCGVIGAYSTWTPCQRHGCGRLAGGLLAAKPARRCRRVASCAALPQPTHAAPAPLPRTFTGTGTGTSIGTRVKGWTPSNTATTAAALATHFPESNPSTSGSSSDSSLLESSTTPRLARVRRSLALAALRSARALSAASWSISYRRKARARCSLRRLSSNTAEAMCAAARPPPTPMIPPREAPSIMDMANDAPAAACDPRRTWASNSSRGVMLKLVIVHAYVSTSTAAA